jgi:hypothetical protein
MRENQRTIRPALAAIVLICFFMPFVKISCGGQTIASITGLDMAMGKKIDKPSSIGFDGSSGFGGSSGQAGNSGQTGQITLEDSSNAPGQFATTEPDASPMQGGSGEMKIQAQPSAAVALACAAIALLAALGASRRVMILGAASSAVVAALLGILQTNMGGEMPKEMMNVISFEWTWSYWVALLGSAFLAVFTTWLLTQKDETRQAPRLVIQSYSDQTPSQSITR